MDFSMHFKWFVILFASVAVTGCASCGEDNNIDPVPDAETDMSVDMTDPNNVDIDMGEMDAGEDMGVDMAPVDTDGDGVSDDEDNCPDTENADQADRDRDDLGDVCDTLPFIHDPTNPDTVPSVTEDETVQTNDDALEGLEYGLELPFEANGSVGEIDANSDPDLDFYSFEIDEPSAILIRITGVQGLWGGGILLGMDWANANVFRVLLGDGVGLPGDREVFLAYPGRYTIAVSDVRNFLSSQADVGGNNLDYKISVSALPLAPPEPVELPTAPIAENYDGTMRVYEVATDGVEGLTVSSTGTALDMNSFHIPNLAVYDPDTGQTLAMNSLGQIGDDYKAELSVKFSDRERLWVIDDFSQRQGNSSTSVTFETADLTAETETSAEPADARFFDVPWLATGESMQGTIGAPRAAGPNTLVGDDDYFLFTAKRGETIRITVSPASSSQIEPLVEIGHLVEQQGESYFVGLHEAPQAELNEDGSVDWLVSATDDGELVAYIQHGPNQFSSNPTGGPSYGYTVSIDAIQPDTSAIATLPGSADLTFDGGGIGIATFTATADTVYTTSEDSSLFNDVRVLDATTWRVLAAGTSGLTFGAPNDGDIWVEVHDFLGRGTDTGVSTVTVAELTTSDLGALPATVDATLETSPRDLYSFTGTAGQKIDIRVSTDAFFPRIQVFDSQLQPVGGTTFERRQVVLPADGDYLVTVSSSADDVDPTYDYRLGVEEIMPSNIATLPFTQNGAAMDDEPFADWFEVTVSDTVAYSGSVAAMGTDFTGRISIHDPDTLSVIRSSTNGALRWVSDRDGTLLISVYDDDNGGDPQWTYDFAFGELVTTAATIGTTTGQLATGAAEEIYSYSGTGGMIEVIVVPTGDWRAEVRLLRLDTLTTVGEAAERNGAVRYAESTNEDYAISVRSEDSTVAGPLDYEITVNFVEGASTAVAEVEPNDTVAEAQEIGTLPVSFSGTTTGMDSDRFAAEFVKGQRVWGLVTDRNMDGTSRFDARLYLRDDTDTTVTSNAYSGEGFLPAIYGYEIPASGFYSILYGPRSSTATLDGDYFLYLAVSDVVEVAETEPNDDTANAQDAGTVRNVTRIGAFVDTNDAVDVFQITVPQSDSRVRVSLEGADPGHELRLLDSTAAVVAASGPSHDSATDPVIDETGLAAGTYFVEFSTGTASGAADIIVIAD